MNAYLDHPIVDQVRAMAEKYPDAQYHAPVEGDVCYYNRGRVENGPPREGCIMREVLEEHCPVMLGARTNITGLLPDLPDLVRYWLREVQALQDVGHTWSEAVRYADRNVGCAY